MELSAGCAARGRFYDERGKGSYITGAVVDITERKQAEEARQDSEARLNEGTGYSTYWKLEPRPANN